LTQRGANLCRVNAELSARDATDLYLSIISRGVRCWVMGGWGVDALLGRQTRPHHDLDLLVVVGDLPLLHEVANELGFEQKLVWAAENTYVRVADVDWPTAFVLGDQTGRELDIHAIEIAPDGRVFPRCMVPWEFPAAALSGSGLIGDVSVVCLSSSGQIAAHSGYDLPPHHQADLAALAALSHDRA
jgi:lincosamide nucleotidyltransferase A/C/D/E